MVALDMALGVACGGRSLSTCRCHQGSVLYLSLDNDGERRLAARAKHLLQFTGVTVTDLPIEFHVDWPTGEAAIRSCQEWVDDEVDESREPLLIVVDTLGKVEPNFEGGQYDNAYLTSTSVLSRWSKFAADNNVAVLAIHHDRKSGDEDWLNRFTGSRGITATAQTLLMIEAERGKPDGMLRVCGRDLETEDLPLHRSGWGWITEEDPSKPLRLIEGGG
jgi:RecA-family ATPase